MKKFSNVLAVALVVLMLMMTSITALADSAGSLEVDTVQAICEVGGASTTFHFSSEEGGTYLIHTATSDDVTDPYINIYYYDDEDCEIIVAYSDDSLFGCYDSEVSFYAEPGVLYFIEIGNYNSDSEFVEYEVCIEEWEDGLHYYHYDYDGDACCDNCGYDYCDHKCHDNGFFWRIANFFNRLFRINQVCECGNFHWYYGQ